MSKMSLIDKFNIFIRVSQNSKWIFIVLLALLLVGMTLVRTTKKNSERNKIVYIAFSLLVASIVILNYHESLNNIFDYMMNNLFIAIYFPNLAIYFAAIIITNIIVWMSIFNFKTSDLIKKVNIIVYLIMNYLLFLILNVIGKNHLDVFSQDSIYNNKSATALIELSSIVFIVWIIFLIVYKIILTYIRKDYKPVVKKVRVIKKVKILPENFEPIEIESIVYTSKLRKEKKEKNYKTIEIEDVVYTDKITKQKEKQKEEKMKKIYEDMLTLEDYKQILQLLKNKKANKKKTKEEDQSNLTELDRLYRSIR